QLGMDSVMIGVFTPERNLHVPNESLDIALFEKGIRASKAILLSVARQSAQSVKPCTHTRCWKAMPPAQPCLLTMPKSKSEKANLDSPQLKQFAGMRTLTGQPLGQKEWKPSEKVARAKAAGFDAIGSGPDTAISSLAHESGL